MTEERINRRIQNRFLLLTFLLTFNIIQIEGDEALIPSERIVNGKETLAKEFGFITSIRKASEPNRHIGGGSILDPKWVLTARHNFVDLNIHPDGTVTPDFFEIVVTPGYSRKLSKLKPRTKYKVKKYFCPNITSGKHQMMFDIGLLRMEREMKSGRYDRFYPPSIPLIELGSRLNFDKLTGKFAGWGLEKPDQVGQTKVLKKFDGKLKRVKCSDYYVGIEGPHVYCFFSDKSVVCSHDGGGPLVTKIGKNFVQFGIIVGGTPQCSDK